MHYNKTRIENDFAALGQFGCLATGGFSRVAFTAEDLAARKWLHGAMEAAGLQVTYDAVGNMRGRRAGLTDLAPVLLGSHLDTVPEGGNYDGTVGVLGALEVVRLLNDRNLTTQRPIEVINFSAEESTRFGVATIGSKALCGKLDLEVMNKLVDQDGATLFEVLESCGYQPDKIALNALTPEQAHAFLELHIEQGPVLEKLACPIGVVSAIAAATRFKVVIEGRADHSGNTPMTMRNDALTAASELILGVERITAHEAGEKTVGTVGYLHVAPGSMNVVPGRVELGIDIRDVNQQDKAAAVNAITRLMTEIADKRNIGISFEQLCDDQPVTLSAHIITVLKDSAEKAGLPYRSMVSGAGHDAMNMASMTDVGMIFIPSVGGVSHNIAEFSHMDDIGCGIELLMAATLQLAQESA